MNKRNKPIIILGIVCILLSGIIFLVTGIIAGWDIAGFFTSPQFVWICVILGLYILFVAIYLIWGKWRKM